MIGAPDIERALGTAHAVLAVVLFVAPGVIALVCEPLLFLLADRYPRRWFIRGGVGAMAVGCFVASIAPGPITLSLALALAYVATGTATGLAQATLVDRNPDARGRTLARWTMWSLAGDLVAPVLLAGLALAGAGWRAAFAIVGGVLVVMTLLLCATRLGDEVGSDDDGADAGPTLGLLATLREALRDKLLIAWLFGCALCDLLDEILVVFASLHIRGALGAGPLWQSAAIGGFLAGSALGLVAIDRLLRVRTERWLLVATSIVTAASFIPWVLAPTPLASMLLAIPVGAASAPLYPLAAAQAYASRPNQSGAVLAAGHLFTPMGLALPWLVGLVADRAGTTVALALLVVQPLGLIALVAASRATSPAARA